MTDKPNVAQAAQRMCVRFEQAIAPHIAREFVLYGSGVDKTFARRTGLAHAVLQSDESLSAEQRTELIAALQRFVEDPLAEDFGRKIFQFQRIAAVGVTGAVANSWFAAACSGVTKRGGHQWFRLDTLGDDMLPRNNDPAWSAFSDNIKNVGKGILTVEEGRDFLRKVKSTLVAGHVIPEECIALMEANDVIVVR